MGQDNNPKWVTAGLKFLYSVIIVNELNDREFKQKPESPATNLIAAGPVTLIIITQDSQADNLFIISIKDAVRGVMFSLRRRSETS